MPGRLGVVWLLHAHQPVGERERVLEEACRERYAPLVAALAAHPTLRVGLHLAGPLAEWLAARHPEIVAALRDLVLAGRVEMIGGGLGAPELRAIPERDRGGQLRAFRAHLEQTYGARVTGAWEWSSLVEAPPIAALGDAGVEWVPSHSTHAPAATPVALVRANGRTLRLLEAGYLHWFNAGTPGLMDSMHGRLRALTDRGIRGVAARLGLEGPDREGVARWAAAIAATDWVESLTPGQALARWRAERVLDERSVDVRAFAASREILDARIRVASDRCALLPAGNRHATDARRHLYRAQCHLPDGERGLGRPELRSALVASAMRAERLAREALGAEIPALEVHAADLNADGRDEVLIQTPALAALVVPHRGGHVVALDDTRAGLDWLVPYRHDAECWPREAAVDRVLPPDAPVETLRAGDPHDESDLAAGVYVARVATSPDEARVVLARAGAWRRGYAGRPVRVEKELRVAAGAAELELRYTITAGGAGTDAALFVTEWNLGLLEPAAADRWLRGPDGTRWGAAGDVVDRAEVGGCDAVDEARGAALQLRADRPVRVVAWPVSAHGRYQATAVALCVPVTLGGDAPQRFAITVRLAKP